MQSFTKKRHAKRARWGYTLIELVVVSASATVLMGGLASSLYIASQSLNVGSGSLAEARTARQALAEMNRDLQTASGLSELTATSVTMSVPDRDGDNVPETIRYAWSGIAGDPLTQSYNSAAVTNIASNVQAFALDAQTRFIDGIANGRIVLFVSAQAPDGDGGLATPSATEQDRINFIENWGYDVTVVSQQATPAELNTLLGNATVVYVSGDCTGATLGTKLNDTAVGVVTESHSHGQQLGLFSGGSVSSQSSNQIYLTDTNHYILAGFSAGSLVVTTSNQTRSYTTGTLAPGNIRLADFASNLSKPVLQVVDAGDELVTGSAAAGHRCLLPWGEGGLDMTTLNSDGQTIMRRAIEWAAGAPFTPNQVAFESFEEAKVATNTNVITIATPDSTTENDLLIAAIAVDGDVTGSIVAPAGWNLLNLGQYQNQVTLAVWWKLADATVQSSHTFNWGNNERAYGWIMRFTGHDPVNPINDFSNHIGSAALLSPATCPAVTSSVSHVMVLRLGGFDGNSVMLGPPLASHTTVTMDASGAGGGHVSGGAGYLQQKVAGSSGDATFSLELTLVPRAFNTVSIAIAPDPNLEPE